MKAAIIFYSFSGNTKRACSFIGEKLKAKNIPNDLIDLRLERIEKAFLLQCRAAFNKEEPLLKNQLVDQSKYDFIIFASPIWAFTFAPALRACLKGIRDLSDKKTACLLTYGSGLGKGRALQELEGILKAKGARLLFSKNIPGSKTKNSEYLESQFKSLIDMIS